MSLLDTASLVITPNGTKAGKLYSVVPSSGAGDMTVTRATTATRVNSAGLIESVASNVPRLDYSNGTCPSILVEPQRTNNILYSEDLNNANWNKANNITVDINASVAPDGNTTADRLNAIETVSVLRQFINVTAGQTYTFSGYIKKSSGSPTTKIRIEEATAPNNNTNIDVVSTGTWQKFSVTRTIASGITQVSIDIFPDINSNGSVFIWGAQFEAGSYATSYIPTTSASVTRNADVINKTGISSLIGQTEGTVFLEVENTFQDSTFLLQLDDATGNNRVLILTSSGTQAEYYVITGGTVQANAVGGTLPNKGNIKLALAYKNNDFAFYANGQQINLDALGSVPAMSVLRLGENSDGAGNKGANYNSVALWKTRLTNTQLAQLTTI